MGEACCSKRAFDVSFKALVKELWPEGSLNVLPKSHAIYTDFRNLKKKPNLMGLALEEGQGRLGVLYIPNGISCQWEVGGAGAREWLDVGACVYLYVEKVGKRMQAEEAEGAKVEAEEAAPARGEEPKPEKAVEFGGAEQ